MRQKVRRIFFQKIKKLKRNKNEIKKLKRNKKIKTK